MPVSAIKITLNVETYICVPEFTDKHVKDSQIPESLRGKRYESFVFLSDNFLTVTLLSSQ